MAKVEDVPFSSLGTRGPGTTELAVAGPINLPPASELAQSTAARPDLTLAEGAATLP
ncbi:MAG TPA: hypothetical protein VFT20_01465 [Candidatus Limnocylindrales bacterium]|nr:hypothetical protein [Candidatus Limnocylindrales bacterium]